MIIKHQRSINLRLFFIMHAMIIAFNMQNCRPFGVRLNFGAIILDPSSPQKLGIRFNTHDKCTNTSLLISSETGSTKVECTLRQISIFPMQDLTNYTSYIHQCPLTYEIQFDTKFTYNIIIDNTTLYFAHNIELIIKNPLQQDRQVKILNVADWAVVSIQSRIPIIFHLVAFAEKNYIDCLLLNGDIGYQLNQNAQHHETFMNMLEQIASKIPVIYNRGNHQHKLTTHMFVQYFQLYDLIKLNATTVTIGLFALALYDPLAILIPRLAHLTTTEQKNSSIKYLEQQLQQSQKNNKINIGITHYPLICSYPTVQHCLPDPKYNQTLPLYTNLKQHYSLMLQYRVPLVLSGHVHSYQRSLPLLDNYNFQHVNQTQRFVFEQDSKYFIQVINGIGGSDKDLFQSYENIYGKKVDQFVASHSENKTGFGLLSMNKNWINYTQYATTSLLQMEQIDHFTIDISKKIEIHIPKIRSTKQMIYDQQIMTILSYQNLILHYALSYVHIYIIIFSLAQHRWLSKKYKYSPSTTLMLSLGINQIIILDSQIHQQALRNKKRLAKSHDYLKLRTLQITVIDQKHCRLQSQQETKPLTTVIKQSEPQINKFKFPFTQNVNSLLSNKVGKSQMSRDMLVCLQQEQQQQLLQLKFVSNAKND